MRLEELIRLGGDLLPHSYAEARTAREATARLNRWLTSSEGPRIHPGIRQMLKSGMPNLCLALWAAQWAKCAYPQVVLSHKLAAALMATKLTADVIDEIVAPWPAYAIRVPDRLLFYPGPPGSEPIAANLLSVTREDGFSFVALQSFQHTHFLGVQAESLGKHLDYSDPANWADSVIADGHMRAIDLATRLIFGIELEMTDHSRVRESARSAPNEDNSGLPKPWTFTLTRVVTIDCRESVRDYGSGRRRSAPSVQVLVRGHWRRQAVGPEKRDRKWMHIEAYWRGPEGALVPMRVAKLKDRE